MHLDRMDAISFHCYFYLGIFYWLFYVFTHSRFPLFYFILFYFILWYLILFYLLFHFLFGNHFFFFRQDLMSFYSFNSLLILSYFSLLLFYFFFSCLLQFFRLISSINKEDCPQGNFLSCSQI